MKYETRWEKKPISRFDRSSHRFVTTVEARFGESGFATFGAAAAAALGDKFVGFSVRDEETVQVTVIEFVNPKTPASKAKIIKQLDSVLAAWSTENGVMPWA